MCSKYSVKVSLQNDKYKIAIFKKTGQVSGDYTSKIQNYGLLQFQKDKLANIINR